MSDFLDINDLNKINVKNVSSNKLPSESGVYIFADKDNKILYIGKSKNLKNRLSTYFHTKMYGKTKNMMEKAEYLSYIKVASEIESLLLEAKLIRKIKPPFNLELKDDKHPLYIRITEEKYPRVLTARRIINDSKNLSVYGPFPSSFNVKQVLSLIRKIFPFSTHKLGKRGCLHSQIGLCEPCPNIIESKNDQQRKEMRQQYLKNIRYIKTFLNGDFDNINKNLKKEMQHYSESQQYEKALEIKRRIDQIEYITKPIVDPDEYVKNPNLLRDIRLKETMQLKMLLEKYFKGIQRLTRIECFDIAHIQGSLPTASMVTFIDGIAEKSFYRRFKINQKNTSSDTDSLSEVAKRRAGHLKDWGGPDLMIIDGGKGQVSVFVQIFGNSIPIVGIAKRQETLIIPNIKGNKIDNYIIERLNGGALNAVQRLRNEAHRFAQSYHHKLIEQKLFKFS
ncbi:GIY-YIG nuclease family protein [Candidatus Woesebacteria bacterium]|nr:GIY-YIG nuclease family protein [Candidatus Woesebacteria bacterium]